MGSKDTFFHGLLMSIAAMIVGYGIAKLLNMLLVLILPSIEPGVSERLLWIIAMLFNIIPMNLFNRRGWYNAMRGVAIGTLIGVAAVIYFFFQNLF